MNKHTMELPSTWYQAYVTFNGSPTIIDELFPTLAEASEAALRYNEAHENLPFRVMLLAAGSADRAVGAVDAVDVTQMAIDHLKHAYSADPYELHGWMFGMDYEEYHDSVTADIEAQRDHEAIETNSL